MKKETKYHEFDFIDDDDYVSLDISSATECTGMVPTPPLTDAEVEGYSDVYSVPQKKAAQTDADGIKKRRDE